VTSAVRSSASAASVMVCHPAFASAAIWARRPRGGMVSAATDRPASAAGTMRWYSRMGTCSISCFAPGGCATAGAEEGYTEPGTTLGSQLVATIAENGVGTGDGVGEGLGGGVTDAGAVGPTEATAADGLALARVWLGDGDGDGVAAPHAAENEAMNVDTSRAAPLSRRAQSGWPDSSGRLHHLHQVGPGDVLGTIGSRRTPSGPARPSAPLLSRLAGSSPPSAPRTARTSPWRHRITAHRRPGRDRGPSG